MNKIVFVFSFWLLVCFSFAIPSVTEDAGEGKCPCTKRAGIRAALVGHKQEQTEENHEFSRQFSEFLSGFREAAKLLRIEAEDMLPDELKKESDDLASASANEFVRGKLRKILNADPPFNFVVTTIPSLAGIQDELIKLRQRGVIVVSIGDGAFELSQSEPALGSLTMNHVGINEEDAGEEAGLKMGALGNSSLCIIDDVDGSSQVERCRGYIRGYKSSCNSTKNNCEVEVITVDATNTFSWKQALREAIEESPSINTIVTSKGIISETAINLLGPGEKNYNRMHPQVASFVIDEKVEELLEAGTAPFKFAVNRQDYIAAFMATVLANVRVTTGQFNEAQLQSGPIFVETNQKAPDLRINDALLEMVLHGRRIDEFWSSYEIGVKEAARDMGFDFDTCSFGNSNSCDSRPRSIMYRSPDKVFNLELFADEIKHAATKNPNGMVVSVPNVNALNKSITSAVSDEIPVFSVNVGGEDAEELGILNHFGQYEVEAGIAAGKAFSEANVTLALCLNHEVGNAATDQRCEGFSKGLNMSNGTVYTISVPIDNKKIMTNKIVEAAESLGVDVSKIDGYLGGSQHIVSVREIIKAHGASNNTKFGMFDVLNESISYLQKGEILFAVDQQQQMQAYLSTMVMTLNALTGQRILNQWVRSGPNVVTGEQLKDIQLVGGRYCYQNVSCEAEYEIHHNNSTSGCPRPSWVGDGWCDSVNNIEACGYDGGDCCIETCEDKDTKYLCNKDRFNSGLNVFACEDISQESGMKRFCNRIENQEKEMCKSQLDKGPPLLPSPSLRVSMWVICSILVIFQVFAGCGILINRMNRELFFSSPQLLFVLVLGCLLISVHGFASVIQVDAVSCTVRFITFHLGFTICFSALLAKIYRLFKVFGKKALFNKNSRASNKLVVGIIVGSVLVNVIICVTWLLLDPITTSADRPNECVSDTFSALNVTLNCYNIAILFLCCIFLNRLDNIVPHKYPVFQKDVKAITRAVYHSLLMGALLWLIFFLLSGYLSGWQKILLQAFGAIYIALLLLVFCVVFSGVLSVLYKSVFRNSRFGYVSYYSSFTPSFADQDSKATGNLDGDRELFLRKQKHEGIKQKFEDALIKYNQAERFRKQRKDDLVQAETVSNTRLKEVQKLQFEIYYQEKLIKRSEKQKRTTSLTKDNTLNRIDTASTKDSQVDPTGIVLKEKEAAKPDWGKIQDNAIDETDENTFEDWDEEKTLSRCDSLSSLGGESFGGEIAKT